MSSSFTQALLIPRVTRFMSALAAIAFASSAICADLPNSWTTKRPSPDGVIFESQAKGTSERSTFPVNMMVRLSKTETYLGFIIPNVEKFSHIDLHALADDNNEGPNPTMLVVKSDSNPQKYSFIAHGEFFEDEDNNNAFSFQFHIGNNRNETKTLLSLLKAFSKQSDEWSFSVKHKGKTILVRASFIAIQQELQKLIK